MPFQEFNLSESNVCELKMQTLNYHTHQSDLVPSDLWRVVVNNTAEGADERYVLVIRIIESICCVGQVSKSSLGLGVRTPT